MEQKKSKNISLKIGHIFSQIFYVLTTCSNFDFNYQVESTSLQPSEYSNLLETFFYSQFKQSTREKEVVIPFHQHSLALPLSLMNHPRYCTASHSHVIRSNIVY